MRVFIFWLCMILWLPSCNSDTSGPKVEAEIKDTGDIRSGKSNAPTSSQASKWTKTEQEKFLRECTAGAASELSGEKLKQFCDCMLLNSQEHYSNYKDMEKSSDDERDATIFAACADYIGDDESN